MALMPIAAWSISSRAQRPIRREIDVLAEGGTYQEHRFAIDAAGTLAGFGVAAFVSQLGDNGPVTNSDYRNDNVALHVTRSFGKQSLSFGGDYNANDVGDPGPYGSDPGQRFTRESILSAGIRTIFPITSCIIRSISRRGFARRPSRSFFLENSGYTSPYGFSYEKDLRGQFETRSIISVTPVVHGGVRRQPGSRRSQEHLHHRR